MINTKAFEMHAFIGDMGLTRMPSRVVALAIVLTSSAAASDWQATASVGFGKYHYVSFDGPARSGEAGIGARYILDAAIGRALGDHLAIEGAWTFQDGDFEIKSGGAKTAFDAHAHSFHADLYLYPRGRNAWVRPFVDGGLGIRLYQGIETVAPRPLAAFGAFAHATDDRALFIVGLGLEAGFWKHWAVRAQFRDFATPFPSSVIVPAAGVSAGGWLHDFAATLGITLR